MIKHQFNQGDGRPVIIVDAADWVLTVDSNEVPVYIEFMKHDAGKDTAIAAYQLCYGWWVKEITEEETE